MIKKCLVIGAFVLGAFSANAQKNVIKAEVLGLSVKKLQLSYERVITDKISVNLAYDNGVGTPWYYQFGKITGIDGLPTYSAYKVTPEIRFYMGDGEAPDGPYLGIYGRYARHSMSTQQYKYEFNGNKPYATVEGNMTNIGGGISFGEQFIIGKHLSIDWTIIGFGVGVYNATLVGDTHSADPSQGAALQAQLQKDFNSSTTALSNTGITTMNGKVWYDSKLYPMLRAGLTIGFAF